MKHRVIIKVLLWALGLVFLGYHSVYFRKLSKVQAAATPSTLNLDVLAQRLLIEVQQVEAMPIGELLTSRNEDFNGLMSEGRRLGVGPSRYFLVEGRGTIINVQEEDLLLALAGGDTVLIATDFIFGSVVRDASGLVSISDYASTMDFNNLSVKINERILKEIIAPFTTAAKVERRVQFKGATRLKTNGSQHGKLRVIPVQLQLYLE